MIYAATQTSPHVQHLQRICSQTTGILFFGTPHKGSPKAQVFSKIQRFVARSIPDKTLGMRSQLVDALHNTSLLQEISNEFEPLMSRILTFNCWEMEKSDLVYTRDYIVGESSAAPIGQSTGRLGIPADHRGMCKFDDNNLPVFQMVVKILRQCSCVGRQKMEVQGRENDRKSATADRSMREQAGKPLAELLENSGETMVTEERCGIDSPPPYAQHVSRCNQRSPPYVAHRHSGWDAACICVVVFLVNIFIIQLFLSHRYHTIGAE